MKYYSSLLEKLLFDEYIFCLGGYSQALQRLYKINKLPRELTKKSELVMADRWYRCCFTKAYFMHTRSRK